jgi:hypothetical protein
MYMRRELSKRVDLSSSDLKDVNNVKCYTAQLADNQYKVTVQEAFTSLNETLRSKYGRSCLYQYSIVLHVNREYENVVKTPFETLSELDSDVLQWKIESANITYIKGLCVCCIVV